MELTATGYAVNEQARENMAYVRRLLRLRQPGFAAALESAVTLAERELHGPPSAGRMGKTNEAFLRLQGGKAARKAFYWCAAGSDIRPLSPALHER